MATITTINATDTLADSRAVINSNLANLNADKVETLADLGLTESAADYNAAADAVDYLVPTGALMPFAGSSTPTGWLGCYGQAISRTTYAALFTAISTTYGVGDGSTTFNIPDLRGRVIAALDNLGGSSANVVTDADADALGGVHGAETHTLTTDEIPSHTHSITMESSTSGGVSTVKAETNANTPNESSTSGATGGGGAHNNVQPTMFMSYIIKT